jgi:DNA-binding winged helix-turn-helix (wHTH) protein
VKYTFGSVRVDADARSVSSDAGPLRLTRKAFDLLILLLESRPNAVSKAQISDRLWPSVFVTESSLQTLVREIRQVIDEPGSERSWIRTVYGVGYGFDGSVVLSGEPADPLPTTRPTAWLIGESTRVGLFTGENILGRGDDVIDIDLPTISRRHACIVINDGTTTLEDLGSKNGTWVGEERVTGPRTLCDGNVVGLGSVRFTFCLAKPPASTASLDELPSDANAASLPAKTGR